MSRLRSWSCAAALAALPFALFWPVTAGHKVWAEGDLFTYNYPLLVEIAGQWRAGEIPLWHPHIFGGTPLLAQMQGGVFYPPNLIFLTTAPEWLAYGRSILLHFALCGVFMFVFLRRLQLNHAAASVGGLVFMLGGFTMSHLGHVSTIRTLPWLPLILAGFEGWRQTGVTRHLSVGAAAVGLMLLAGHPQIPLYALLVLASYAGFFAFTAADSGERSRCRWGLLAIGGVGLTLAGVQLLPTAWAVSEYLRPGDGGWEYFTLYSVSFEQLVNLLFPGLVASDLVEQSGYVGIAPLALGAFALVAPGDRRVRHRRYFGGLAIAALWLVLGSNTPLFSILRYVPLFRSFTSPGRHWFEFTFAAAALAAFGVQALADATAFPGGRRRRTLVISAAIALAVILASAAAERRALGAVVMDGFTTEAIESRLPIWLATLILLGAIALAPRIAQRAAFGFALATLVTIDLFGFGGFIYNVSDPDAYEVRPASLAFLNRQSPPFRTLTLEEPRDITEIRESMAPDYSAVVGIESLNGFDSLMLRHIDEASQHGMQTYGLIMGDAAHGTPQFQRFIDLLNARYVLVPAAATPTLDRARYREVFRNRHVVIHENVKAVPRFFLASEVRQASVDEAMSALESGELEGEPWDPGQTALVPDPPPETLVTRADVASSPARIAVVETTASGARVSVESAGGLLVHATNMASGWTATIDGTPAPVHRVDGFIQGTFVPPGRHDVRFRYRPWSFVVGAWLSALGLAAISMFLSGRLTRAAIDRVPRVRWNLEPLARRIPACVVIVACALCLYAYLAYAKALPPLHADEAGHALPAARMAFDLRHGHLVTFLADTQRELTWPFVHPWYLTTFFLAFGVSTDVARGSSLFAFAAALVSTFFLARELAHPRVPAFLGTLTVALMVVTADFWSQSATVMIEPLGMFVTAACLHAHAWAVRRRSDAGHLLAGLLAATAFLVKYNYGLPLVAALVLSAVFARGEDRPSRGHLVRLLLGIGAPTLIWLGYPFPAKLAAFYGFTVNRDEGLAGLRDLLFYPSEIVRVTSWSVALGLLAALLWSLRYWRDRRQGAPTLFVLMMLAMITAHPNKQLRYMFTLLPVAYAIGEVSLLALVGRWRRAPLLWATVVAAVVLMLDPRPLLRDVLGKERRLRTASSIMNFIVENVGAQDHTLVLGSVGLLPHLLVQWEMITRYEAVDAVVDNLPYPDSTPWDPRYRQGYPIERTPAFERVLDETLASRAYDRIVTLAIRDDSVFNPDWLRRWDAWGQNYVALMQEQSAYPLAAEKAFSLVGVHARIYARP